MEIEERIVAVDDLRLGMFVCRLDRPWVETPFPLQGFLLEETAQLDQLRALCREVTIDEEKSSAERERRALESISRMSRQMTQAIDRRSYSDASDIGRELPRAREVQENLAHATQRMLRSLREGSDLISAEVSEAVTPVVASVLRSADALFWLSSLRKHGDYEHSHALNCTVLSAAFGRHLGLPEEELHWIASGGLLLDIGKTQLPAELLSQTAPLSAADSEQIRQHVDHSVALLRRSDGARHEIIDMVAHHHERVDGSGYPNGLVGAEIPLFARIAAIIDSFDAMISERPYRVAMSRHSALQQLYASRDTLFQSELVERFIQCIGAYPTGSLVELSTGEVAIVQAQNRSRQLLPQLLVLTTPDKKPSPGFRALDLLVESNSGNSKLRILRTLPPGSHGLDAREMFL